MILTDNETSVDLLNDEAIAATIIELLRTKPDHTMGVLVQEPQFAFVRPGRLREGQAIEQHFRREVDHGWLPKPVGPLYHRLGSPASGDPRPRDFDPHRLDEANGLARTVVGGVAQPPQVLQRVVGRQ